MRKKITIDKAIEEIYPIAFKMVAEQRNKKIKQNEMYHKYRDNEQHETFCHPISDAIQQLLEEKFNIKSDVYSGDYTGPGCEYSEDGFPGCEIISHCIVRLPDNTIIDGSSSQFKPRYKHPKITDRVAIIGPKDKRQEWYEDCITKPYYVELKIKNYNHYI